MSFKDSQNVDTPADKLLMVLQLEEEDKDLGEKCADAPNDDLDEPCADIDILIWVKFIVTLLRDYRHIFVCIDSAFQDL